MDVCLKLTKMITYVQVFSRHDLPCRLERTTRFRLRIFGRHLPLYLHLRASINGLELSTVALSMRALGVVHTISHTVGAEAGQDLVDDSRPLSGCCCYKLGIVLRFHGCLQLNDLSELHKGMKFPRHLVWWKYNEEYWPEKSIFMASCCPVMACWCILMKW